MADKYQNGSLASRRAKRTGSRSSLNRMAQIERKRESFDDARPPLPGPQNGSIAAVLWRFRAPHRVQMPLKKTRPRSQEEQVSFI